MPKSLFSAVSVFSLDSSNLCREVKKLQVFYMESFPPAVAFDSKIRLSPIYSKYCKWIIFCRKFFLSPRYVLHMLQVAFYELLIFSSKFFKSPLCTPLVASGCSYVLHILQVANFWIFFFSLSELFQVPPTYSTCCKWLLSNFLFFGQNFSKSPLFTPLAASGCWTKNSFPQSLFFRSIVVTYVVEVNFPLYFVTGT